MVTYCLDTGIAIGLLRKEKIITEKIISLESNHTFFITPVTLCEIYKGLCRSKNRDYEEEVLSELLITLPIYDFNQEACRMFGDDFVRLQRGGKLVDDFDVMIASIAKAHGAILVTRNKKHFENTGVKIEEW